MNCLMKPILFILFSLSLLGTANAEVTYTYTSNAYNTFYGVTDSSIMLGNQIFATATFADNSAKDGPAVPIRWSISDGLNEITSEYNPKVVSTVTFSFLNGSIDKWQYFVYIFTGDNYLDNIALLTYNGAWNSYDQSITNLDGKYKSAYIERASGVWVLQTAPVPEPSTYAMLGLGLGVMGFAARRRKSA